MENQPAWLRNSGIKECFDSLPKMTQEAIMQSSNSFNSAEELKRFAENFNGSGKNS